MRIGVLALQGSFAEHINILEKLGAETVEIRNRKDLEQPIDGIILPGGESTVMGKLLQELEMFAELKELITGGLPVFGTCAGMILLADRISGRPEKYLATMNITVKRNAYGRQLGSFTSEGSFGGCGHIPMRFIRAPYIEKVGKDVVILAEDNGKIVAARQHNQLATSFHPELSDNETVHRYFMQMIENYSS